MKKLSGFLKKAYEKQIDGTGLAVFRIVYSCILLCEIAQLFYFRKLIFDPIPNIVKAEISFAVPIILWFITVVFLLFGFFTRFFSILNYLLGLILIGTASNFEYHVYYAYMGINFLLLFVPVSTCFSVDRLILKLKHSNTNQSFIPSTKVSQLYYFIIPLLAIGFVYFDSVFYKLSSSMWINGLGSWLPCSLPMITHINNSWLLNQEYLIKFVGWFTVFFEAIFIFIFFRKKFRIGVFIIGMMLHLGILIQFPLPWFALVLCAVYLLLVPVSFWKNCFSRFKTKKSLTVYNNQKSILDTKLLLLISHFDWFGKIKIIESSESSEIKSINSRGKETIGVDVFIQMCKKTVFFPLAFFCMIPRIYQIIKKNYLKIKSNNFSVEIQNNNFPNDNDKLIFEGLSVANVKYKFLIGLITFLSILQFTMLYGTWLVNDFKSMIGFKDSKIDTTINSVLNTYAKFSKFTLGITGHPVFSNEIHFDGYNHIVSVVYLDQNNNEIWLPIIDKNGQPDTYIYGANWVNWTFRINEQNINLEKMSNGIQRYTAFWAYRNNIDLTNATFKVKVKKIDVPNHWENDFLNKQIASPWIDGGFVQWKDYKFNSEIKNIESL